MPLSSSPAPAVSSYPRAPQNQSSYSNRRIKELNLVGIFRVCFSHLTIESYLALLASPAKKRRAPRRDRNRVNQNNLLERVLIEKVSPERCCLAKIMTDNNRITIGFCIDYRVQGLCNCSTHQLSQVFLKLKFVYLYDIAQLLCMMIFIVGFSSG